MKNKIKGITVLVLACVVFSLCVVNCFKMESKYTFRTNGYFLDDKDNNGNKNHLLGTFEVKHDNELKLRMKLSARDEKDAWIKLVSPSGRVYEKTGSNIQHVENVNCEKGKWSFEVDGKNAKKGEYTLQVLEK